MQMIVVSQIRLDRDLRQLQPNRDTGGADERRRLDDAEEYARVMGLPPLLCDIAQLRASLRIRDVDLKTTASVAGQALSIAAAHEHQLM